MKGAYKHDYSGSCCPKNGYGRLCGQNTFSVGIFQWLPKSKDGLKKSAVKVRVYGYVSNPEPVYEMAYSICEALDAGIYNGTKTVKMKPQGW